MRYDCDYEGYDHCYVEISDSWTRGEIKRFFASNGDDFLSILQSKVTAIHLDMNSGVIDSADKLTVENSDNVDMGLWRWFATALNKGVDDLYSLGEANARRWLDAQGKSTTAPDNQTQK